MTAGAGTMRAIVFDKPGDESRCPARLISHIHLSRHGLVPDKHGLGAGVLHMGNIPPPKLGPHDVRIRYVIVVAAYLHLTSQS